MVSCPSPKRTTGPQFSMSVVFERKSLAANMLCNEDICPRAKKPGENGGAGSGSAAPLAIRSMTNSRGEKCAARPASFWGSTFRRVENLLKAGGQFRRQPRQPRWIKQADGDQIANVHPILVAVGSELH